MKTITPPTFKKSQKKEYNEYLNTKGFALIEDVLPEDQIDHLINTFWEAWTYVSPKFNKNDKVIFSFNFTLKSISLLDLISEYWGTNTTSS